MQDIERGHVYECVDSLLVVVPQYPFWGVEFFDGGGGRGG